MFIEVNDIEYCRVNVKFEEDPIVVEQKRNEVVGWYSTQPVKGFRTGKAPIEAVKYFYKDKIEETLQSTLAQNAFQTVVAEKNIRPFGKPQYLSINLNGSKFKCDFALNKLPDFELKKYKNFEIPKPQLPDAVEMGEKILQELRERNGEATPFTDEDILQNGDNAIINYAGYLKDNENPEVQEEGKLFTVGKDTYMQGFTDNLLGMKLGEKREFTLNFSPFDSNDELRDKNVRYIVELTMASKSVPAALDDNLAIKVGLKNLNQLVELVQSTASNRLKELEREHINNQIAVRLVAEHDFQVPTWLKTFEARLLAKHANEDWDKLSDRRKEFLLERAEQSVKMSLILDKVRDNEPDTQLTNEEIITIIKQQLTDDPNFKSMNQPIDEIIQTLASSGYLNVMAARVKDEHAMEFIIKSSTIIE